MPHDIFSRKNVTLHKKVETHWYCDIPNASGHLQYDLKSLSCWSLTDFSPLYLLWMLPDYLFFFINHCEIHYYSFIQILYLFLPPFKKSYYFVRSLYFFIYFASISTKSMRRGSVRLIYICFTLAATMISTWMHRNEYIQCNDRFFWKNNDSLGTFVLCYYRHKLVQTCLILDFGNWYGLS